MGITLMGGPNKGKLSDSNMNLFPLQSEKLGDFKILYENYNRPYIPGGLKPIHIVYVEIQQNDKLLARLEMVDVSYDHPEIIKIAADHDVTPFFLATAIISGHFM